MGKLEDFVGCTVRRDLAKMTLKIYQPHLITKMTQVFNEYVKSLMDFNTTYSTHKEAVSNQETEMKISNNLQKIYRNGIELLLYIVKHL